MPTTKSSTGSGARRLMRIVERVARGERDGSGCAVRAVQACTSVISTSREPHRPSDARNMSAGRSRFRPDCRAAPPTPARRATPSPPRRLLRPRVSGGELLFLADLDVGDVGANHALGIAEPLHPARIEPQRLVAESLDQPERMGDEQDRLAATLELGELVEALVGEALRRRRPALRRPAARRDRRGSPRRSRAACTCPDE